MITICMFLNVSASNPAYRDHEDRHSRGRTLLLFSQIVPFKTFSFQKHLSVRLLICLEVFLFDITEDRWSAVIFKLQGKFTASKTLPGVRRQDLSLHILQLSQDKSYSRLLESFRKTSRRIWVSGVKKKKWKHSACSPVMTMSDNTIETMHTPVFSDRLLSGKHSQEEVWEGKLTLNRPISSWNLCGKPINTRWAAKVI